MNSETQFIIDVWDVIRDNVPVTKRIDAARGIMKAALEYGFEQKDISGIVDEDADLEEAFYEIYEVDLDEEEEIE